MQQEDDLLDDLDYQPTKQVGSTLCFWLLLVGCMGTFLLGYLEEPAIYFSVSFLFANGLLLYFNRRIGIFFSGFIAFLATFRILVFLPISVSFLFMDLFSLFLFLGSFVLSNDDLLASIQKQAFPQSPPSDSNEEV